MTSKIEQLKAAKAEFEAKMRAMGQDALKERFTEFFDANPRVHGLVWTQYTPHFNDGDACTFSVHEFMVMVAKTYAAELAVSDCSDDYPRMKVPEGLSLVESYCLRNAGPLREAVQSLQRDCNELDSVMESAFGDHVKVTATRGGFDVEEYEHD